MRVSGRLSSAFGLALVAAACGGPATSSVLTAAPTPEPLATLAAAPAATRLAAGDWTPVTATPVVGAEPAADDPTSPPAASDEAIALALAASEARSGADNAVAPAPIAAGLDAGVVADPTCDGSARLDPLPVPGSPQAQDFFRSFRTPLPPAPLYDPPGQKRVGLQAGHWLTDQVPPELGRLQGGALGGGKQEWEVNLSVAQRTAALLEASGIGVDILPSTVPPHYRANAFVALHADGDPTGAARGFKVARPGFSSLPDIDDRLVESMYTAYAAATELPRDDEHISLRMRYYYAFNSRRYCHAVAPGVPQAIVEMAYLTSASDRQLLIGDPDRLARGVAEGIRAFLAGLP